MNKPKQGGKNERFRWDYPAEGFVYDKERCAFAKYPKHTKSLEDFVLEIVFFPRNLEHTFNGFLNWRSDREITKIL